MCKACAECGEEFEAKRKAATYCSGRCTKRAQRRPKAQESSQETPKGPAPVRDLPTQAPSGSVEAATRSELADAGCEESAAGQSALALARRIDGGSVETASGVAALVREHRAVLAKALENAEKSGDDLDELRARRERKLTG